MIGERSTAGRTAAKERGRLGGRPEKFGSKDIEMMKSLIVSGKKYAYSNVHCFLNYYNLRSIFLIPINY
ncbi:DNA invertase Pin-like site-specific DNA recombinase [Bacillus sp. RC250]